MPGSEFEPESLEVVVARLKAAAEPSRLRILRALDPHDLTVSDLCRAIGQSQPRVSRHLKLLLDAGLVDRNAEGSSAFFRITREPAGRALVTLALAQLDPADLDIVRDLERVAEIRAERAEQADDYFSFIADEWETIRSLHVGEGEIETALADAVGGREINRLVDLGTGTGRILELFGPQIRFGLGIDTSRDMLAIARSRLERAGLAHCEVRQGDMYRLDLADSQADVVIIHHVLHFLDDPGQAIREAARVLAPGGDLLVVDFASHDLETLRTDFAHQRLGFADDEMTAWFAESGLARIATTVIGNAAANDAEELDVVLWRARHSTDASSKTQPARSSSEQP